MFSYDYIIFINVIISNEGFFIIIKSILDWFNYNKLDEKSLVLWF